MASLGMKGLFNLTSREIDSQVTKTSPGNYALGRVSENKFYVYYVGRSDTDLNGRLKDWVDEYDKFRFSYAASPKAAFKKECQNYHDFGETDKLDNKQHPQRPDDSNWKCPVCDILN